MKAIKHIKYRKAILVSIDPKPLTNIIYLTDRRTLVPPPMKLTNTATMVRTPQEDATSDVGYLIGVQI